MSKSKQPATRPQANPLAAAAQQLQAPQQTQLRAQFQQYSGSIPPPEILRQFDEHLPGTAARLINWAESEQQHRRKLEAEAQAANADAQRRQLAIAEFQMRGVFRSDMVGQAAGLIVCLACVAGAVHLGSSGATAVAVALCAIPTGAVIYAFRGNLFSRKADKQDAQR